jgi:hypothetical protein
MFVRGIPPIWFEFNLTGQIFDDTYYAFFLTNTLPYLPQAVFQDPNGLIPWPNPIEFSPNGGLSNNLYFNPAEVYRIEFREGPDDTYPLIGNPIQNYIPGSGSGTSVINDALVTAPNVITDPQFSDVLFSTPSVTFTTAGTYNIAPGWQLLLVGTGSAIVTQTLNPGSSLTPGNPPTFITIATSGSWTNVQLIQTFANNGALFSGGAIAIAFTAEANGSAYPLTVEYSTSGPADIQDIFAGIITTGAFVAYYGATDIDGSVNPNTGAAAFTQIIFQLADTGSISLTNIQITGQSQPLSDSFVLPTNNGTVPGSVPPFYEQTAAQIVNGEFYLYRNALLRQAKNTILVGWEFGLNPWQFTAIASTNVAANQYTADQTIVIQQAYVATAVGNNIAVGQGSLAQNYGFTAMAVTANNQFGILQYIAPQSARPYWGSVLSSMITGILNSTHSPVTAVKVKMRLIWIAGLPSATSQTYPVATWTAGGDPVFATGVTAIIPPNDPSYTLSTAAQAFAFDGMTLPAETNANMTLGIFVYTTGNMNQAATADAIVFNDISLVPNSYALASNPKTADEVLRECEYYWEQSYAVGTFPGAATASNAITVFQNTFGGSNLYATSIEFAYKQTKNQVPALTFWSPDGTGNTIQLSIYKDGALATASGGSLFPNPYDEPTSAWTITSYIDRALLISRGTTTAQISATTTLNEGLAQLQYTANARLG